MIAGGLIAGTLALTPNEVKRVARRLASVTPVEITALPDGTIAATRGTVAPIESELLVAPITGRRCVFWFVLFEEVGADIRELGRAQKGQAFLLASERQAARVVPDHVLRPATPPTGNVTNRRLFGNLVGPLAAQVCKRPNHTTTQLRATEYAIEPGHVITVCGWVTREPDPTSAKDVTGYRTDLPTRPVFSGTKRTKLLIGA